MCDVFFLYTNSRILSYKVFIDFISFLLSYTCFLGIPGDWASIRAITLSTSKIIAPGSDKSLEKVDFPAPFGPATYNRYGLFEIGSKFFYKVFFSGIVHPHQFFPVGVFVYHVGTRWAN